MNTSALAPHIEDWEARIKFWYQFYRTEAALMPAKKMLEVLRKGDLSAAKRWARELDKIEPGAVAGSLWSILLDGRAQSSRSMNDDMAPPIHFRGASLPSELAAIARNAALETSMLLPSERHAKFPAGVSMTVDEVAEVVGDSFKEMNENPPPEVVKLREEMTGKTARFEEGPEGAKQFDAWMKKQPKEVQDDWAKYTEENGDKFKTAAAKVDLKKIKDLSPEILSAKIVGGKLVVVLDNYVGNMTGKGINQQIAEMLADGDNWNWGDDSSFYANGDDVPKGKKNQYTYNLKTAKAAATEKTSKFGPFKFHEKNLFLSADEVSIWVACRGDEIRFSSPEEYQEFVRMLLSYVTSLNGIVNRSGSVGQALGVLASENPSMGIGKGIGNKVKGPLESEPDEPYMKGQFTQVDNSELSGKVAKGQKVYGTLEWLE